MKKLILLSLILGLAASAQAGDYACKRAQRSYELATTAYKPNQAKIEAARSRMYIACKQPEPTRVIIEDRRDSRRYK